MCVTSKNGNCVCALIIIYLFYFLLVRSYNAIISSFAPAQNVVKMYKNLISRISWKINTAALRMMQESMYRFGR